MSLRARERVSARRIVAASSSRIRFVDAPLRARGVARRLDHAARVVAVVAGHPRRRARRRGARAASRRDDATTSAAHDDAMATTTRAATATARATARTPATARGRRRAARGARAAARARREGDARAEVEVEVRARGRRARGARTARGDARAASNDARALARDLTCGAGANDGARRRERKPPAAQRALTKFLELPAVPIGSFVSSPTSPLHRMDARVKQAWLAALLLLPASGSVDDKIATCALLTATTVAALPRRVWRPQLQSLMTVCAVFFVAVAIGADSVAPVVSTREPPASLEGLEGLPELASSYKYVLFHLGPLQLTRKGINLAVTSSAMTFTVLQSAHLALCVTTPEAMAAGLRWYLAPLRALRVPVEEVIFTLLLSLRFTSIVFEEVRNLSLGLAARDIDWRALGWRGSVDLSGRLLERLLDSLFANSAAISDAVISRGYKDAASHRLMLSGRTSPGLVENVVGIVVLVAFVAHFNEEAIVWSLDAFNTANRHALGRG